MESTNRITDDTMESAKYGLQTMQLENGRPNANRPPAQVTLYHLKWARSALQIKAALLAYSRPLHEGLHGVQ